MSKQIYFRDDMSFAYISNKHFMFLLSFSLEKDKSELSSFQDLLDLFELSEEEYFSNKISFGDLYDKINNFSEKKRKQFELIIKKYELEKI